MSLASLPIELVIYITLDCSHILYIIINSSTSLQTCTEFTLDHQYNSYVVEPIIIIFALFLQSLYSYVIIYNLTFCID